MSSPVFGANGRLIRTALDALGNDSDDRCDDFGTSIRKGVILEQVALGRSELFISRVSFGAATFGGPDSADLAVGLIGVVEQPEADALINLCLESGITYFDTANVYSGGDSETILGAALGARRKDVVIGTKVGMPMGPGVDDRGCSRRHLIDACDASLRRLGTDWIDLYQIHYPDYLTPLEETLAALDQLVRAGKVRYIGCSNFSGWHMTRANAIAEALGFGRFISHQVSYSLVDRDPEHELIPGALDQGIGVMAWGPLSGGFLSGKYHRGAPLPEGSRFAELPNYPGLADWEKGYQIIDVLRSISKERGRPVAEIALNWVLRKPWMNSVIIGARNRQQLEANLRAAEWSLTVEEVEALDSASSPRVPYPYWVQQSINSDRTPKITTYRN